MQQHIFLSPLAAQSFHQYSHEPASSPCPFLGPIYPPATNISATSIWQEASLELTRYLTELPSVEINTTSFAIQIVSLDEPAPLFELYNTAPDHLYGEHGLAPVDGDAVFRIASTSKMLAIHALLLKCGFGCFDEPITTFIPELRNQPDEDDVMDVHWDEITVGMLASHVSGIGREFAVGDLATDSSFGGISSSFGLPDPSELDPSEIPKCAANPDLPTCSRKQNFEILLKQPPTFPTSYSPAYSNTAFQLLGYVIENITGQSFEKVMNESIFEPLNMKHSSVSIPRNISTGVRFPGDPMFEWNLGDFAAAGGIYSSTRDLALHALSVMNNTQLTAAQTRRWLKPQAHTSSLRISFGMPWEIIRYPGLSSSHIIDVYTKSGGLPPYSTQYGLIPDLRLAYVVNALSVDHFGANAGLLAESTVKKILRPMFEIARDQAAQKFAGLYTDLGGEGDDDTANDAHQSRNSSIRISVPEDGIGLLIDHWISNGKDVLEALGLFGMLSGAARLFPTTLTSRQRKGDHKTKVAFRSVLYVGIREECVSWGTVGGLKYGGLALDMLVFEIDEVSGRASALSLPAYRATYGRVA